MSEIPEGYIIVPASAWHELVQYELKCQELAATVEALKLIVVVHERELPNLLNKNNEDKFYLPLSVAINTIVDAVELRQKEITKIRAEAGRYGFIAGAGGFWHRDHDEYVPSEVKEAANHYAEYIRQEKK